MNELNPSQPPLYPSNELRPEASLDAYAHNVSDAVGAPMPTAEQSVPLQNATELGVTAVDSDVQCPVVQNPSGPEAAPPKRRWLRWTRSRGEHNRRFRSVSEELTEAVGQMNTGLADIMHAGLAEAQAEGRNPVADWVETANVGDTHELPYGETKDLKADPFRLPTEFFLSEDGQQQALVIPRTGIGRGKLVRAHAKRLGNIEQARNNAYQSGNYTEYFRLGDRYSGQTRDPNELHSALKAMKRQGVIIDPVKWQARVDAVSAGPYIETLIQQRNTSTVPLIGDKPRRELIRDYATGRYQSYIVQKGPPNSVYSFSEIESTGVMPVGEYGAAFAKKLLDTTQYTMSLVRGMAGQAKEQAAGHGDVITKYTARGADVSTLGDSGPAVGLMNTTEEGVLTVGQALALLTAEKVEGYDDPMALVWDIKEAGLINRLTAAIPTGIVGPFAMAGVYFPGIIRKQGDTLRLNPEVLTAIKDVRRTQVEQSIGEWALWDHTVHQLGHEQAGFDEEVRKHLGVGARSGGIGGICPAARRGGGLNEVSDATIDLLIVA